MSNPQKNTDWLWLDAAATVEGYTRRKVWLLARRTMQMAEVITERGERLTVDEGRLTVPEEAKS